MENNRTYYIFKESGVALVNTLIIVAASLLLIGGIYYLTGGGFKVALINKKFSSTQEAAAGGVQEATEALRQLINDYNNGAGGFTLSNNMGFQTNYAGAANVIFYCQNTPPTAALRAKTADGRYQIDMTIACLGQKPVPGSGGAMIFPPPPSASGGGGTAFYIYSITAQAQDILETKNPSIGQVQAVYRLTR